LDLKLTLLKQYSYRRFCSTGVLRQAGWRANLELCTSIQVQCRLTVLCSETRPNAKPENVVRHFTQTKLPKSKLWHWKKNH